MRKDSVSVRSHQRPQMVGARSVTMMQFLPEHRLNFRPSATSLTLILFAGSNSESNSHTSLASSCAC